MVVPGIHRLRAVDQQRLHQRRAVGALEAAGVKLLHQGQHAADRRGGHAGAGVVPVLVAQLVILFLQRVGVCLRVGGGDRVFPVAGTGGDDERAGRDQVRLEAAVLPLDADAHVAPARERRHLVVGITHAGERRVGGRGDDLLLNLVAFVVGLGDGVGLVGVRLGDDLAARLDRADGDHVLRRAGRGDGVWAGIESVVSARAGVAGRENINHLLVAGSIRQRVARGGVVARGRPRVIAFVLVLPTVIGDQHIYA